MRIRTIVLVNEKRSNMPARHLYVGILCVCVCEWRFFPFSLCRNGRTDKSSVVRIVLFYSFVIINFNPLKLFTILPFFIVRPFCIPFGIVCVEKRLISFVCTERMTIVFIVISFHIKDIMRSPLFYFSQNYFDLFDDVYKTLYIGYNIG